MGGDGIVDDSAQMILVGALALAVVFVGIALVLNSAIFAENLATRANQQAPSQINSIQQESVQSASQAIDHHNHDPSSHASYTELETRLQDSVQEWSDLQIRDSAREGRYIDVDITSMRRGTRVTQDDGSQFKPQDDGLLDSVVDLVTDSSWAVTPRDYQIRDFRMTLERDNIGGGTSIYTEAKVSTFLGKLTTSTSLETDDPTPFTMVYDVNDDDTYEHAVSIYRPDGGDSDDVSITYYNTSTGSTTTCQVDAPSTFDVDVSGGEVEGGDGTCDEVFDFQSESDDPYQLIFVEGEEVEGDYQFIVDEPRGTMENEYNNGLLDALSCTLSTCTFEDYYEDHVSHDDTYSPSSPYVEPAIYSAEVTVNYQSNEVSSTSTVRIAPNEP